MMKHQLKTIQKLKIQLYFAFNSKYTLFMIFPKIIEDIMLPIGLNINVNPINELDRPFELAKGG